MFRDRGRGANGRKSDIKSRAPNFVDTGYFHGKEIRKVDYGFNAEGGNGGFDSQNEWHLALRLDGENNASTDPFNAVSQTVNDETKNDERDGDEIHMIGIEVRSKMYSPNVHLQSWQMTNPELFDFVNTHARLVVFMDTQANTSVPLVEHLYHQRDSVSGYLDFRNERWKQRYKILLQEDFVTSPKMEYNAWKQPNPPNGERNSINMLSDSSYGYTYKFWFKNPVKVRFEGTGNRATDVIKNSIWIAVCFESKEPGGSTGKGRIEGYTRVHFIDDR